MLLFELAFDTLLMAVMAGILIFYVILVIKLKPSNETEQKSSFKKPIERMESIEKPVAAAETQKVTSEEPILPVETQKVPEEPIVSIPTQTGAQVEAGENQKKRKEKESKKSLFLYGKKDFEGCPHNFGYLKDLPKNTPIPDECFGCPKVIECLTAVMMNE